MTTDYKKFCEKYNNKLKSDKDIKENGIDFLYDFRDRISFNLYAYTTSPTSHWIGLYNGEMMFSLDAEDLKYLYDKYSKKIESEMEQKIAEIKDDYKVVLSSL